MIYTEIITGMKGLHPSQIDIIDEAIYPYRHNSHAEYANDLQELKDFILKAEIPIEQFTTLIRLGTSCWSIIPQDLWEQIPIVNHLKINYPDLYKFMGVLTYG